MLPASLFRFSRPDGRRRCGHWLLTLLLLALAFTGCARQERPQTRNNGSAGSLSPLYSRLPERSEEQRPFLAHTSTPQSELSIAVGQSQSLRLQGEFQKSGLALGAPIFIRIFKESHELELWVQRGERYYLFRKYPIAYFSGGLGPKLEEGDQQAPEGFYAVSPQHMNPWSNFHLAFNVGYPNQYDLEHNASGGLIMIHGKRESIGCFAMTDRIIEEIYTIADRALNAGQPAFHLHIFPFRMTPANLQRHAHSPHFAFWRNILHGYTLFELTHVPPLVTVQNRHYAFSPGRAGRNALAPPANMVSIGHDLQVLP